ncbi:MAG TPA: sigma-70 family RNA polymerase sigma factor [Phycisphaerae bacterium]|nr:sigma-70 family RNA polymerase sigma factor [Phycisphaerae bacterium]HRY70322.1 sigma-70 family RNA polymerase sigma factor [Phycisphaerae bacterium]HSA28039.1 sigma-70 family RNA polymerase sigma factor [Phycisphaerae bacterium]
MQDYPCSDADDQLLDRAAAGDQTALESLLLNCYPHLAARIARKLPAAMKSQISPEDILQETFAEIFRHMGRFEAQGAKAFFRWVAGIADHRLVDAIKAQCAAKRGGGREPVDLAAAPEVSSAADLLAVFAAHSRTPSRSAARHEAVAAVQAALNALGDDQREALRLRYIEGLPVAQIAERMSRTEGSVHMLCNRGLKELRAILGRSSEYLSHKA